MDSKYKPKLIRKTYEQQKNDLLKVLYYDEPLYCSEVNSRWSNVLELLVEPIGWIAVWKVSRDFCSKLKIPYPTLAVVEVQNVDFIKLTANVTLVLVEENCDLPETCLDIPLIQLFPTDHQMYNSISIDKTADILHDLRVFYLYLWYPWDERCEPNDEDWITSHLEDRLQLHYDILSSQINQKIMFDIEMLIEEGKHLYKQIIDLETSLEMNTSIMDSTIDVLDPITKDQRFLLLSKIDIDLSHIAKRLNQYEKKFLRNLMVKKEESNEEKFKSYNKVFLAFDFGTIDNFSSFLKKVKSFLPDASESISFEVSCSLDKLLNDWKKTSSVHLEYMFVNKGSYLLKNRHMIGLNEAVIQGVGDHMDILIKDDEESFCLLDILCIDLKLSNVSFKTSKVNYTLLLKRGSKCHLKNVNFSTSHLSKIAIFVSSGAQLIAESCNFCDCFTAIHAENNSSVNLKNCVFENNVNGLEFKHSNVTIDSCKFINNKGVAILLQPVETGGCSIENDVTLEDFQGLKIVDTIFTGNKVDRANYENH